MERGQRQDVLHRRPPRERPGRPHEPLIAEPGAKAAIARACSDDSLRIVCSRPPGIAKTRRLRRLLEELNAAL